MAKKRKKQAGPVLSALCIVSLLAYVAFGSILAFQLISKGILNSTLFIAAAGVLGLIAIIGLLLTLSRKTAVKIIAMIVLFTMAGVTLTLNVVIQDIDRTIASMTGDASTVSTPISVVTGSDAKLSGVSALGGRTVGYSDECTPTQFESVKAQISGSAADVNFVECGPATQALQSMLSGSLDALIVPENILLILGDEIMPELNDSISTLETYIITESYKSVVPEKPRIEVTPEPVTEPESPAITEAASPVGTPLDSALPEEAPVPEEPLQAPAEPEETEPNSMLVYISGNDYYGNIKVEGRSDVNIIAAINFDTHKVFLVNTPRDYYLPISISENGTSDKLTHCGIYGIQCSMDTLANAYGLEFDHFFKLNFTGFINIIDALGGIDIYNDFGFVDNGLNEFSMGDIHLNGQRALLFARNRHQVGIANRGNNHMKVIQAVVNKIIDNPEYLLNYTEILASLEGSFMTDFTAEEIYAIVNGQLSDMRGWSFENYSVQGQGSSTTKCYSAWGSEVYIVIPNYDTVEEAAGLLRDCLEGK